jgi:predicted nuclease of predicted toxin-antitoxin system
MWLLDVNMPNKLAQALFELGVSAETTHQRGWDALTNARLLEAAVSQGFNCLLTRDRLFAESAARALKRFPHFRVVVVTLPQLREKAFLDAFRKAWDASPILSVPGEVVYWPT